MTFLWNIINRTDMSFKVKRNVFLACNTLLFALVGFLLWITIGQRLTDNKTWAICFIGYQGYFIGYLGGLMVLVRKK